MGAELRRLKPQTITRALVALRAEMIRDGAPGLEHVEALLVLRGSNLPPVPRKAKPLNFRRGRLRMAIYAALKDGPLPGPEIVARVCAGAWAGLCAGVSERLHAARPYAAGGPGGAGRAAVGNGGNARSDLSGLKMDGAVLWNVDTTVDCVSIHFETQVIVGQ